MSINSGQNITYGDLKTYALNMIKKRCCNVNANNSTDWSDYSAYSGSTEANSYLRKGASWTIVSKSYSETKMTNQHGDTISRARKACTVKANASVSDNLLVPVYHATIDSQFTSFLNSKGISTKSNETVSFKGMLNFMNNLAVFMAAKLVYITNSINTPVQVFYISSASPNTTQNKISDDNLSANEIKTNLTQIMAAINNVTRMHYASTAINYACSSSSSSSSSSTYIVYMDI